MVGSEVTLEVQACVEVQSASVSIGIGVSALCSLLTTLVVSSCCRNTVLPCCRIIVAIKECLAVILIDSGVSVITKTNCSTESLEE